MKALTATALSAGALPVLMTVTALAAQAPPVQAGQGLSNPRGPATLTEPAGPTPRSPDGRVRLGGETLNDNGVWQPDLPVGGSIEPDSEIPFQSWARALYADRQVHKLEPHTRCKASGGTRPFQTPYGVELLDLPDLGRVFIFEIGGGHTYRTVFMDGRTHPPDAARTSYGHSIGWWDDDTLVVETTAFNESFWLDRRGLPHTEQLRTLERFARTDSATLTYEVTIDDPGAYTKPWTGRSHFTWRAGVELFEYICQQTDYAQQVMLGLPDSVDRSSPIVP